MKEFNKTQELRKIKFKQNKNTYIKKVSIILSCVILLVGIIMFTFAKFESNKSYTLIQGKLGDYSNGDITLSYVVDGVKQNTPPDKNNYLLTNVTCTNADFTYDAKTWFVTIGNYSGKVKCNLTFEEAEYNNVTKWLATANVNKSYTTLAEVFNDTTTLSTLTNNNASCDYLKNSTEWINDITSNENAMTYIGNNDYCADQLYFDDNWDNAIVESTYWDKVLQPLVPTMTSNTDPSGECFGSSSYNASVYANGWWHAFNPTSYNGGAVGWFTIQSPGATHYLAYDYKKTGFLVKAYEVGSLYQTKNIKIQGSNDNEVWNDIDDSSYIMPTTDSTLPVPLQIIDNTTPYRYHRFVIVHTGITTSSDNYVVVRNAQFYGREVPE